MSATTFTDHSIISIPRQSQVAIVLRWIDRVVFVMLLGLMVLVAVPYGTVEPWWVATYECAVFGLAAICVLAGFFKTSEKKEAVAGKNTRLEAAFRRTLSQNGQAKTTAFQASAFLIAPALAITAFVFIQSVTVSADQFETRLVFFKTLALLVNAMLLFHYVKHIAHLQVLIHVLVGLAVVCAVYGIARQSFQVNEVGFGLPLLRKDSGFAQFVNKNHFALFMEMVLGLATGLLLARGLKRSLFLIYGSAIAVMWTALILTSSRGGLFTMLGQLAFVITLSIWFRARSRKAQKSRLLIPGAILGFALLIVVSVGAVWVGGDLMVTRLESLSGEITAGATEIHAGVRRREVWSATWQLIKTHPVVGSGFGAYTVAITEFHDASGKWTPEAAHNDYLELLASGGMVGTLLAGWLGLVVIRRAWKQLSSRDNFRRAAALGALTGIFGVVAHSLVDFGIHVTANFVVLLALVVIATKHIQAKAEGREQLPNHKHK